MTETSPVVKTMNGPVRGRAEDGLFVFRGIRYGAPPVGADRFKPSRRPMPWTETRDASAFGPSAIQMPMGLADTGEPSPLKTAIAPILPPESDKTRESEDCLFLNVWTPGLGDGKNRPVMVWLHGGGYSAGSGSWPVYDGAALARNGDVVVISLNHRLNVFGYLCLADLAGMDYAQSGNAGMLDILLALLWIRDNAAAFGGDRDNVIVFGESGGGFKVATLLAMRATRTYIHKAIIQSGPGVRCLVRETATATARSILAELHLTLPQDLKKLQEVPAPELVAAAMAAQKKAGPAGRGLWLSPVMDGFALAGHPFDPVAIPAAAKIPLLVGYTRDEGTFFLLNEPKFGRFTEDDVRTRAESLAPGKGAALVEALKAERPGAAPTELVSDLLTAILMGSGSVNVAERKAAQEAPVYAYRLDWRTPVAGGALGATHALDVQLMFNTMEAARSFVGDGDTPKTLADKMSRAWLAFAKTGDPNVDGLPAWPRYDAATRATMLFDTECRVVNDPSAAVRKVLLT